MMLALLYRKIIPQSVRDTIYDAFLGNVLANYRRNKEFLKGRSFYLYYSIVPPKTEKQQALKDWGQMAPSCYPYLWAKEYDEPGYSTYIDKENGLPYVMHQGRKLYFRRDMIETVSDVYKALLIEQDVRSAHRYVDAYEELAGKTLLDIGTAEGIFTLDTIEYVRHAYLFECDEAWIEALEATFRPWKDKITIVRKYVSDVADENTLTLDTYFEGKAPDDLFLKMDIEGYERKALAGCASLLTGSKNITGTVCVYHLADDKDMIGKMLNEKGMETFIQPGFLYYEFELRNGVIRFKRSPIG